MSLIQSLTRVYSAALEKKAADPLAVAPELSGIRNQFEDSVTREQTLRKKINRLQELVSSREEDNVDVSPLEAGLKRLVPMPHTPEEAVLRGAGTVGGAGLGYVLGAQSEVNDPLGLNDRLRAMNPDELHAAVAKGVKGEKGVSPLQEALQARYKNPGKTKELLRFLRAADPNDLAAVLQGGVLPATQSQQTLREELLKRFPKKDVGDNLKFLARELQTIGKGKGSGTEAASTVAEALLGKASPYRIGGALAGAGAGAVLSGVPHALYAAYATRHGGEAALRAKADLEEAMQSAQREQARRNEMLATAGAA